MYCLVEFSGPTASIGIVYKSWICGAKCYWPPFWRDNKKLNAALKKATFPDPATWQLYEAHVIGNRYFATYDEARKKQNLPSERLDASDLSSAEEITRLRKRTINQARKVTESSSEDEGENLLTPPAGKKTRKFPAFPSIPSPPSPPSLAGNPFMQSAGPTLIAVDSLLQQDNLIISSGEEQQISYLNSSQSVHGLLVQPTLPAANESSSPIVSQLTTNIFGQPSMPFASAIPASIANVGLADNLRPEPGTGNETGSVAGALAVLGDAVKGCQIQQASLAGKLDLCLDMLRTILHGQAKPAPENDGKFNLPLTREEDLLSMQTYIKDDRDARNQLVSILSTTGGDNINQITHRVMTLLMTDDMMTKFSIAGKKGKYSFRESAFMSVVCDAVRKQPKGSIGSDKEIGKAAEYWLKKASLRLTNRAKKTK